MFGIKSLRSTVFTFEQGEELGPVVFHPSAVESPTPENIAPATDTPTTSGQLDQKFADMSQFARPDVPKISEQKEAPKKPRAKPNLKINV